MNIIVVEISRDDIEAGDTSSTVEIFVALSGDRRSAMGALGRVALSIGGYDNDPRSLWEIPEVRQLFASLRDAIPHMLFFLSPEMKAAKLWLLLCCETIPHGGSRGVATDVAAGVLMESFTANNVFCARLGIDPTAPELVDHTARVTDALTA